MSEQPRKAQTAVIGAGYFGRFHLEAWSRMPEVACRTLIDIDGATAESAAQEFGFAESGTDIDAMLARVQPDIVDITTPPDTHLDLIKKIAPSGAAIQCQKPFCRSLDEAREAVAFAADADVTLAIHENFRFQPWHRQIKLLLDQAILGDIFQATFRLRPGDGQGPDAYLARQPYFQKMQRFLVRETAIHQIDLFRFLFGEPTGVFAHLTRLNPAISGEDAGIILFDFSGSTRALFDGNRLSDHRAENTRRTMGEMMIEGSKACLRLDGDARIWLRQHGSTEEREHHFDWQDNLFGGDCVYATCRAFLNHVLNDAPLENVASAYLRNCEIEETIYRSNEEKRWLAL